MSMSVVQEIVVGSVTEVVGGVEADNPVEIAPEESAPLERQGASIAGLIGEDKDEVAAIDPQWLRMMQEGVVVELHIKRWRATARLTWDDLGLPPTPVPAPVPVHAAVPTATPTPTSNTSTSNPDDLTADSAETKATGTSPGTATNASASNASTIVAATATATATAPEEDLLRLGEKRLLPKKLYDALNTVESKARKNLERYAFKTFWGYFLPATVYSEWKASNEEYRTEYFKLRDKIVDGYDEVMSQLVAEYSHAARTAYRRMKRLDRKYMTGQDWLNEAAFVAAFIARIHALIPTREQIRDSFDFEVELRYIPLPSLLAEDLAVQDRVREERRLQSELDREEHRLEVEKLQTERTQLEVQRHEEWARVQSQQREELARQKALEEMNRDVLRQAQEQKSKLIDGFLSDLASQLRTRVYEATTDVLASIQKNQNLGGKSASQLRSLIEQVGKLNFFNDREVEGALARIEALLDAAPRKRDVGAIETQLHAIATVTRATLLDLGVQPRSARTLGVADNPGPELVRTARHTLGVAGQGAAGAASVADGTSAVGDEGNRGDKGNEGSAISLTRKARTWAATA